VSENSALERLIRSSLQVKAAFSQVGDYRWQASVLRDLIRDSMQTVIRTFGLFPSQPWPKFSVVTPFRVRSRNGKNRTLVRREIGKE
jgi:hypothetical protein